jgi:hypothetical protein
MRKRPDNKRKVSVVGFENQGKEPSGSWKRQGVPVS